MKKAPKVRIEYYNEYTRKMKYSIGDYRYEATGIPVEFFKHVRYQIDKKRFGRAIKLLDGIPGEMKKRINAEENMKNLVQRATAHAINEYGERCKPKKASRKKNPAGNLTKEQEKFLNMNWQAIRKHIDGLQYSVHITRKPEWTSDHSGKVEVKIIDKETGEEYPREADIMVTGGGFRVHVTFMGKLYEIHEIAALINPFHKVPKHERHVRNPLNRREWNSRINKVQAYIEKARGYLASDPHKAEEEAYQALGLLEGIEQEGKSIIGASREKREIVIKLRAMLNQIIGYADKSQGRGVPNPLTQSEYDALLAKIYHSVDLAEKEVGWGNIRDAVERINRADGLMDAAFGAPLVKGVKLKKKYSGLNARLRDLQQKVRRYIPKTAPNPGEESFEEKMERLAQHIGIDKLRKIIPVKKERIAAALAAGDEHLNSIPLYLWDIAAGRLVTSRYATGKPRFGSKVKVGFEEPWGKKARGLSLSERVCILKHVAKYHLGKQAPNPGGTESKPLKVKGAPNLRISYEFLGYDSPQWQTRQGWMHPHYRIIVHHKRKKEAFDYWGSYRDYQEGKTTLDRIELIEAFIMVIETVVYGRMTLRDFTLEFGYASADAAKMPWHASKLYGKKWSKLGYRKNLYNLINNVREAYDL